MPERAYVLKKYGLPDAIYTDARQYQDPCGQWKVAITAPGRVDAVVSAFAAAQLVSELRPTRDPFVTRLELALLDALGEQQASQLAREASDLS